MAIRRYCDWCDAHITGADTYFSMRLDVVSPSTHNVDAYHALNDDICTECYDKVAKLKAGT